MTLKPKLRSTPSTDTLLSFPSKGPVLDEHGNTTSNDHSTLYDVGGTQAWLHNERSSFDGKEVHITHSHAIDLNLVEWPEPTDNAPTIGQAPDSAPTTRLAPGHSGNKPVEDKSKSKSQTTSAFSNTGPERT